MKPILVLVFTLLFMAHSFGQKWQRVDQQYYGMKYELPKDWEIDSFGSDNDWEFGGSSVCDCAGTVNIGNRYKEDEVYMVVYPSKYEDSLNATKRTMVWGMTFEDLSAEENYLADHCIFTRDSGRWSPEFTGGFTDYEVWQFKTSGKGNYYVLYFWALPQAMKKHEKIIYHILDSFEPVM